MLKVKITKRSFNLLSIIALAVLSWAAAVVPCAGQNFRFDARAARGSRVTYLDLVRKIFADASFEKDAPYGATASRDAALRHLFGAAEKKLDSDVPLSLYIADRLETSVDKSGKILWLIISVEQPEKYNCEDCGKKI